MKPKIKRTRIEPNLITHRIHPYFPFPLKLAVITGMVFCVIGFMDGVYWTVFPFLLGIVVLIASFSVQFDILRKRYRFGLSIPGIQFGRWLSLNRVNYISIFPTTSVYHDPSVRARSLTRNRYYSVTEVRVNFVLNNRKRERLYTTNRVAEAQAFGLLIGEKLNLGVYDCTTSDHHWVHKAKH